MPYVSSKDMILNAKKGGYAIGHFNLFNMESIIAYLQAAQEMNSPAILAVSSGSAKYMGGYKTIVKTVTSFIEALDIKVPISLHVDHGTYEEVIEAIEAGFKSVMFDGSALSIEENIEKTKYILSLCKDKDISLECEVGTIGGVEDGISQMGELADPKECQKMASLGIDMLAAGVGNIHGKYPEDWPGLNFEVLGEIQKSTNGIPLVLHGGSGIPDAMIKKAISLGVSKINVNTESQNAFVKATQTTLNQKDDNTGMSVRGMLSSALEASKQVAKDKIMLFGSQGKA